MVYNVTQDLFSHSCIVGNFAEFITKAYFTKYTKRWQIHLVLRAKDFTVIIY